VPLESVFQMPAPPTDFRRITLTIRHQN